MAMMVLLAAHLTLSGNDLSDHCSKIELTAEVEDKDVTTFASEGWKEVLGGLKSGGLAITLKNDYAASEVDAIMWPLFGTVVTFAVRPSSASVGTSNPSYSGSVLIKEYKPVMGAVGDVAEAEMSYPTSGAVARATS